MIRDHLLILLWLVEYDLSLLVLTCGQASNADLTDNNLFSPAVRRTWLNIVLRLLEADKFGVNTMSRARRVALIHCLPDWSVRFALLLRCQPLLTRALRVLNHQGRHFVVVLVIVALDDHFDGPNL